MEICDYYLQIDALEQPRYRTILLIKDHLIYKFKHIMTKYLNEDPIKSNVDNFFMWDGYLYSISCDKCTPEYLSWVFTFPRVI